MNHSTEELLVAAYHYFPRGIPDRDPRYAASREVQRQMDARVAASSRYETWRAMLDRLQARFPQDRFPGLLVVNRSLFLKSATAAPQRDRCFTGELSLPVRTPEEKEHHLEFLISFVVPYYTLCSVSHGPATRPSGEPDLDIQRSFDLSAEELPFAAAIREEVEATFPGHEPIAPEVGLTVVPDVVTGSKWFGDATIFTCLFSDGW